MKSQNPEVAGFASYIQSLMGGYVFTGSKNISHYTSVSAAHSILSSGKMFAGHSAFMNDPDDGFYVLNNLVLVLSFILSKEYPLHELDEIVYNYFGEYIDLSEINFDNSIIDNFSKEEIYSLYSFMISIPLMKDIFFQRTGPYFISFCKYSSYESLSHWRAYGDNGSGVRIDFRPKSFIFEDNVRKDFGKFYNCQYLSRGNILKFCLDIINNMPKNLDYINNINESYDVISDIILLSSVFKDEHYSSENEVRFITWEKLYDVHFKTGFGVLKPYIEVDFNRKSINRIMFGPRSHPRSMLSMSLFVKELQHKLLENRFSHQIKAVPKLYVRNGGIYSEAFPEFCRSKIRYVG